MKSALVFMPIASPTYVPFGLALLVAHVNRTLPEQTVKLYDFNLALWLQTIGNHPDGDNYLDFITNRARLFYEPQAYLQALQVREKVSYQIHTLLKRATRYVETGEIQHDLETILSQQAQIILSGNPTVIGFSVMYLNQLSFSLALAKYIDHRQQSGGVRLIFGGASILALNPEELLAACPFIDAIVPGEGESALTDLLSDMPYEQIPGLIYSDGNGIRVNPRVKNHQMLNARADYSQFDLKAYLNPEIVLPAVYSRDCDWGKCRFCAHNFSFSGFRKKSVMDFVDELSDYHCQFGVRYFYFADQYIAAGDLEMIALEIINRGLHINYHVMCRPLADYTRERLEIIARSGCRWISWGVESGSQRLLDLVKKGTRVPDIEEVLKNAAQAGISNLAMMIFGLPSSSDFDLWQTFSLLDRTQEYLDVIRASAYVLYDKTYFAHKPERFDLSVSGKQKLLEINGKMVHSTKYIYREAGSDGTSKPPKGALEVVEWERRIPWMKDMSFMGLLPSEHYLLYTGHRFDCQRAPDRPFDKTA